MKWVGGRAVWVKGDRVISDAEYNVLDSHLKYGYTSRTADATVFVRGYVKHPDHDTIILTQWHNIMMNEEKRTKALVFLD